MEKNIKVELTKCFFLHNDNCNGDSLAGTIFDETVMFKFVQKRTFSVFFHTININIQQNQLIVNRWY